MEPADRIFIIVIVLIFFGFSSLMTVVISNNYIKNEKMKIDAGYIRQPIYKTECIDHVWVKPNVNMGVSK